jgi:RimJ/RimL family protein N-acetyltransferase
MKSKPPDFPMPITTDRLIIRPLQIGDAKILHKAILESFNELRRYMQWANNISSLEDTEKYVHDAIENWIVKKNDEPYLPLIILDKNTNDFIGGTSFHHYNWDIPSIETGYWIRKSRSGCGLMTEAINAQTQYAFKQLGVKRIAITWGCVEQSPKVAGF